MMMGARYDPYSTRLSSSENQAIDNWTSQREQDAEITSTDIEGLVRILRQGTPVEIWNGQDYVPLRADMLSGGEKSGKIYLGGPA